MPWGQQEENLGFQILAFHQPHPTAALLTSDPCMNPFVKNEERLWAKISSPSSELRSQSRNSKDIWQRGNQGRPVKKRKRKLVESGEVCLGQPQEMEKEERWGEGGASL